MTKRALSFLPVLLLTWGIFLSCESELYPPTDPPVLSNIVLTCDSSRSATTSVRAGDTVYVSVDVEDPEDDPETLALSVLSGGSIVASNEVSSSRIFDDTTWETWFETTGLATGSYSVSLTATDKDGNEGDAVSKDFSITADDRSTVDVSAGAITISGVDYILKNADVSDPHNASYTPATGDPFRIVYSVTNNTTVTIDVLEIPFTVNVTYDDPVNGATAETYSTVAVTTSLEGGATASGICNISILNDDRTIILPIIHDEASCTATIY